MNDVMVDMNKPLVALTAGEFLELLMMAQRNAQTPSGCQDAKRYEYGIAGIANIFHCSMSTANRIKASGRIDDAIRQSGRTIIIDVERAIELLPRESNV